MNIFFISTMVAAPWGGSEELWHQAALRAQQEGHRVYVSVNSRAKNHSRILQLQEAGISVRFREQNPTLLMRVRNRFRMPVISPSYKYWAGVQIDAADILVISLGSTFDFLEPTTYRFLSNTNKPFVLLSQFNSESFGLHSSDITKAKALIPKAKKFYFVAERNRQTCEHQLAATVPNAELIYNPVKVQKGDVTSFPAKDHPLTLACVSRLQIWNKGQDALLRVLNTAKWRERKIQVRFYGSGPDEEYLKDLIRFYHLEDNCQILGHVEDVASIWKESHAMILPSVGEGTPLALIEAMAAGRAALVTDVGDNAVWVKDNETGFVALGPSPAALDEALERLWASQHRLQEMGQRALNLYTTQFPSDPVKFFLDKLEAVVSSSKGVVAK